MAGDRGDPQPSGFDPSLQMIRVGQGADCGKVLMSLRAHGPADQGCPVSTVRGAPRAV